VSADTSRIFLKLSPFGVAGDATRQQMKRLAAGSLAGASLVATLAIALVGPSCGGTSGRENLPGAPPGMVASGDGGDGGGDDSGDAGVDATVNLDATMTNGTSLYTNTFDVLIEVATRPLPDVQPATGPTGPTDDSGAPVTGLGYGGLPPCPPWIAFNIVTTDDGSTYNTTTTDDGGPISPWNPIDLNQAPSDFAPDGSVSFAAPGSACATYSWLGVDGGDQCTVGTYVNIPAAPFPPCSWAVEAGTPTGGAGQANGETRYQLCIDLYQCMMRTGCYQDLPSPDIVANAAVTSCFCGVKDSGVPVPTIECDNNPLGPCKDEELAAFEVLPTPANYALVVNEMLATHATVASFSATGWPARFLNEEFVFALRNRCIGGQ
jgi:hypothetical protein